MSRVRLGISLCYFHRSAPAISEILVIIEGQAQVVYAVPVCAECCTQDVQTVRALALEAVARMRAREWQYYQNWCRN